MSKANTRNPSLRADRRVGADERPRPKKRAPSGSGKGGSSGAASGGGSGGRPPRRRKPQRRPQRRGGGLAGLLTAPFRWLFRVCWAIGWRVGILAAVVLAIFVGRDYMTLPPYKELLDGRTRGSVTLTDRSGETFAWRGDQFGGGITAESASPYLKHAIIATEDKRFYHEFGVSPIGVLGAMRINLEAGRGPFDGNGGSTITQQTAKLLCSGTPFDPKSGQTQAQYEAVCRAGSLERKAREAVYALALEAKFTKDQILTIYMNRAYLGAGTTGFEAASQRYFGKSAKDVTPAEAAMLAGLLQAPTRYAPTNDLARSQARAKLIIGLMQDQGYLNKAEADKARAHPATLDAAAASRTGGYFADWVMSQAPDFLSKDTTEDVVMHTTLDMEVQEAAEEGLAKVFDDKVKSGSEAEAAVVVMSPDGAIRAMVGGREPDVPGGFNRAVDAVRQTGSSFKPFVYGAALDAGYRWNDIVYDTPLTINIPGSGPWSPQNYEREFRGPMTLAEALAESENVPAVKVAEAVGLDKVRAVARGFGVTEDLAQGPAVALGASGVSLLHMTAAYAGILAGGVKVTPFGLTSLSLYGDKQSMIDQEAGPGDRVISQEAAEQLIYMMSQVVDHGTGTRAKLGDRQVAGKTGTTSSQRDAWFIGFTGDYVTGVWMGYDDNRPLTGVTGGGLPAEIWHEVMSRIEDGLPKKPLPMLQPQSDATPRSVADGGTGGSQARQGGSDTGGAPDIAEQILNEVRNLFRRN